MPLSADGKRSASPATARALSLLRSLRAALRRKPLRLAPREAYRLWAETYDAESDNAVLALEHGIFRDLLGDIPLAGRSVVDVGCGTGRHWGELMAPGPARLQGVDSSPEMLARLRSRHPEAALHVRPGEDLEVLEDASVDVLVSTLMLGHVRDADRELREWVRVLRGPGAQILLTDFHPAAHESGMKRTFSHRGETLEVEHRHVTIAALRALFASNGLEVVRCVERALDASVEGLFERRGRPDVLRHRFGTPLVIGFHLRLAG
jgi:ubiquinone/menaquinone biosynthesis C-methylase UbiE